MSKQKSPYFYKNGANAYHWELRCASNHYKASNESWHISDTPPERKTPCKHCGEKTKKISQFWDRQK